ncbi:hypothetical protein Tco_0402947, partial [Tanacetum coccineum]
MITNQSPYISIRVPNSVKNPSVSAVTDEATCDGTVSGIIGDEIGEGTIKGAGEMGSEPDDHSGDGGVCAGGAGGG